MSTQKKAYQRNRKSTRRLWIWAAGTVTALLLASALYFGLFTENQQPVDLLLNFQQYHYGAVPEEFDYDATGSNGPVLTAGRPFWRIYVDKNAPSPEFVLIQAASLAESDHYPIALLKDVQAKDVTLSVYLKPMGGDMDKSQGLVWRARDKDNYYAALASALDGKLHLIKMVDSQPQEIASAAIQVAVLFEQQTVTANWGWYTLKVEAAGTGITVWFDGEKMIEATDKTFTRSGRVGLVTHADSIAVFDDFSVQSGNNP